MHWTIAELAQAAELPEKNVRAVLETNWTVDLLAAASSLNDRYIRTLLTQKKITATKLGHNWVITREGGDVWLESRGITVESENVG